MLADIAKPGTLEQIIIKMQHNCVSDRNVYTNQNLVLSYMNILWF